MGRTSHHEDQLYALMEIPGEDNFLLDDNMAASIVTTLYCPGSGRNGIRNSKQPYLYLLNPPGAFQCSRTDLRLIGDCGFGYFIFKFFLQIHTCAV